MCKTIKLFTITKIRAWVFYCISKTTTSDTAGFPLGGDGWRVGKNTAFALIFPLQKFRLTFLSLPSSTSHSILTLAEVNLTLQFNLTPAQPHPPTPDRKSILTPSRLHLPTLTSTPTSTSIPTPTSPSTSTKLELGTTSTSACI